MYTFQDSRNTNCFLRSIRQAKTEVGKYGRVIYSDQILGYGVKQSRAAVKLACRLIIRV